VFGLLYSQRIVVKYDATVVYTKKVLESMIPMQLPLGQRNQCLRLAGSSSMKFGSSTREEMGKSKCYFYFLSSKAKLFFFLIPSSSCLHSLESTSIVTSALVSRVEPHL